MNTMIPFYLTEHIEKSIEEVGIDPFSTRGKKDGQWTFKYKNSTVWVDVFSYPSNPEKYYFQVMSPLCKMVDKKAEEFAIDLLEKNGGEENIDGAYSMNNLANIYRIQGRYSEAEVLYKKSLNILKRASGKDTIDVAASMANLANLYMAQGKCMEADLLLKKSKKISEKILGKKTAIAENTSSGMNMCIKSMVKTDDRTLDMQT